MRARILVVALWVGSLWTVGYIAAPTLFMTLSDKVLAGTIAGNLFRIEAWLSIFCAVVMTVLLITGKSAINGYKMLLGLVAAMLICSLIGYFGLQPFMASLRASAGPAGIMESDVKIQFGILHGVSSLFYLIQSVLGAVLVLKIR